MAPVINLKAVFIAAVFSFILRISWFRVLFVETWKPKILPNKKTYLIAFITAFFMAFIYAHIIKFTYSDSINEGFQAGFWIWFGFYLMPLLAMYKFERTTFKTFLLNAGFHFFEVVGMGIILALGA